MGVNKNVIRKMSTIELLKYVKEDNNKFVYEACEYAFDILQNERGIIFSEKEIDNIRLLLEKKRNNNEESRLESFVVDDTLQNEKYPLFYSQNNIIFLSTVFSPIIGAVLLYLNLKTEKKIDLRKIFFIIIYMLISFFLILLYNFIFIDYISSFISKVEVDSTYIQWRPYETTIKLAYKCFINILGINFLWNKFFGNRKRRSKSIIIPFLIGLFIYLIIFLR